MPSLVNKCQPFYPYMAAHRTAPTEAMLTGETASPPHTGPAFLHFLGRYPHLPRFCQTRVPCLRRRRNKAPSIGLSPHVDLAGHRGGSRSARRVIYGSARFYGLRIMCCPEVPSNLALIFRSKISMGFRTYFFRDKYSAPRIHLQGSGK